MTKNIIKIFLLIITTIPTFAQGGSNYSIFGLGDIIYGSGAAYQAMGGAQTAVPSINNINLLNPAMLAFVTTTRLQTGYRFNQNVVQNDNNELWQNNGGINGFASVFNFDTSAKMTAALFMQPISTVNYLMEVPVEVKMGDNTFYGNNRYQGEGGLSALSVAFGSKVTDWLYLGGTFSSIFGKVDQKSIISFKAANAREYELRNNNTFESYSYKLGLYTTPIENLGIGLFYEYVRNANVDHRNEYIYPYNGTRDSADQTVPFIANTIIKDFSKVTMPNYFGAGISYITGKFMIAGDYLLGTFSDLSINAGDNMSFRNMQRFSLGVNRMGNPNPFASLADKAAYKFGLYYEQLYYVINNNNIDEMALTAGLQYPLSRLAQIDLSFAIGKRGTTSQGLMNEWFGRIVIDISIGDTWFNPVKRY